MTLVGVDGCPGGWVAALLRPRTGLRLFAAAALADVLRQTGASAIAAIDMPLSLPTDGRRRCDEHARRLLRSRRSTLFFAPPSKVLGAATHSEACQIAEATTGKRISIQAWNLAPKIREADELLKRLPERVELLETHPELCFARLAGGEALADPKKTPEGQRRRFDLMRARFGEAEVDAAIAQLETSIRRPPVIDQLDALACLSTAMFVGCGEHRTLPDQPAPNEPRIVY